MRTARQTYHMIYTISYEALIGLGYTPDQASRKANITAVKSTWKILNDHKSYIELFQLYTTGVSYESNVRSIIR